MANLNASSDPRQAFVQGSEAFNRLVNMDEVEVRMQKHVYKKFNKLLQFIEKTKCQPTCTSPVYRPESVVTLRQDNMTDNYGLDMTIDVYVGKPSIQIRREYWVFDSNDLLADAGGLLGILLGFSILSFFDDVIAFVARIKEVHT